MSKLFSFSLAVLLFICCPQVGNAISLFPADKNVPFPELEALIQKAKPGTEYVYIDDMAFRVTQDRSAFLGTRWPDGVVFYEFDDGFDIKYVSPARKMLWLEAAAEWSAVADVRFVERTTEPNYIHVQNSSFANNSFPGMVGGAQIMNITSWDVRFIIAHEMGHALGLQHEQSRSDRDTYVKINAQFIGNYCGANSDQSCDNNFYKLPGARSYGAYDFESIMHYPPCSFDIGNCPPDYTIEAKPPDVEYKQGLMGNSDHFSALDGPGMAAHYGAVGNNACAGGIVHDDGSFEEGFGWSDAGYSSVGIVQLFTPPSYPWSIDKVCIGWGQLDGDPTASYEVVVFDDDGPGGQPGTFLGSAVLETKHGIPGTGFDLFSTNTSGQFPVINEGGVYVGARWNNINEKQLRMGTDTSVSTPQQTGWYISGTSAFASVESGNSAYQSMAIRVDGGPACQPDAYEPDETNATEIVPGVTQTHSICGADDEDIFHFPITQVSQVVIEITGPAAGDGTKLWLGGASIDPGEYNSEINYPGGTQFSRIDRTCGVDALQPDDYSLYVWDYLQDNPVNEYSISVTVTPCATLTVNVPSYGSMVGTVTTDPPGQECSSGSVCTYDYPPGTVVAFSQEWDLSGTWIGFSGDPDCNDDMVTMNSDVYCEATFIPYTVWSCYDEYEPEFGCDGGPITLGDGGVQTHSLCDADWVGFDAVAGQTYVIETLNLTGTADTEISLWGNCSSTPVAVANDDNSGPDGVSSYIKWTAPSDAAMQVQILDASGYYYEAKGYDIRVKEYVPPPEEVFDDGFEDP